MLPERRPVCKHDRQFAVSQTAERLSSVDHCPCCTGRGAVHEEPARRRTVIRHSYRQAQDAHTLKISTCKGTLL